MRLQTLELKGFKSFADKTLIHFNEAMTAIVGLNGSGKSNTVDAIRWVLGEQKSRSLRLEKMDNLIFNGTRKRKPSGRAEVSLTFENTRNLLPTDYTTVTITRVLYRTGDSEYRLNGIKCRLKDITNLFMDTGISSDSYAIIELKMIDEILNDKENSRRKLFEQAAGISKYKTRKRETLNKLNATDADLNRIEDLLYEIENNLKTLEKQAKRTQKYYKLKKQYKETSIQLAIVQTAGYKTDYNNYISQKQVEQDKRLNYLTKIAQLEAKIEQLKSSSITQEKALAQKQANLNELIERLRKKEKDKELNEQQLQFLSEKQEVLKQQITTADQLIESLKKEADFLQHDLAGEEKRLDTININLAQLKENVQIAQNINREKRNLLEQEQQKARALQRELFDIEKKQAVSKSQLDNVKREMSNNKIRFESRKSEIEKLQLQLKQLSAEREKMGQEVRIAQELEAKTKQRISQLETNIEQQQAKLSDINRSLDSNKNEYRLTKSLVDSLEGFPDSVKFLKKNSNQWNEQQAPLLLDIINCPDEYKASIENYLKTYLNNYVVATAQDAQKAIGLLDKKRKGKASFFILKDLKSTNITAPVLTADGLQLALNIVSTEAQYQTLIEHLLHKVYVVETTNQIPEDALQNGYVFITKDAKNIRQKSTLEGGSKGAYEGKRIGKRQQLNRLKADIDKLAKESQQLNQLLQYDKTSLKEHKNNLFKTTNSLRYHQNQLNKLASKVDSLQANISNLTQFIEEGTDKDIDLVDKIKELETSIARLNTSQQQLKQQQNEQNQLIAEAERNFREGSKVLSNANQAFNQQNIEFHKQENRISTIKQNLTFKKEQLDNNSRQFEQNKKELNNTQQQLKVLKEELAEAKEVLKIFYINKEKREKALSQAEGDYYQVRGQISDIESNLKEQLKAKQQIEELINQIDQQFNQLKMKMLSVEERLKIEFDVLLDDVLNQPQENPQQTGEELSELVEKIRKRVQKHGDINPMAVEAFDEMKERYDFIMAQREDLLEAKKVLTETMREIESTATEKFMEAFNQVRVNFQEMFRSLFTQDDQCDLLLTNPSEPLESTIDIIAKPKGKRPQSINQLSGGEKSLTALALVFSLYLLKPAPFCILDEVDAPLDDSNVGKFTSIIRKFSEKSQFILVTHKKNTMAAVDVLYGVTMQEEGVSTVIPADFRKITGDQEAAADSFYKQL